MSTPTAAGAPSPQPELLRPLLAYGLFDPGTEFPHQELRLRILSVFWRHCCQPRYFSRAPAPVLEFAEPSNGGGRRWVAAWWLLETGIAQDREGPDSPLLRPYFGGAGGTGHRWPRYEFSVTPLTTERRSGEWIVADMAIHAEPLLRWRQRIRHAADGRGFLRVAERELLSHA